MVIPMMLSAAYLSGIMPNVGAARRARMIVTIRVITALL
jgi:hypothetical protein